MSSVEPSASPIETSSRAVSISGDPALSQSRWPSSLDICCIYDSLAALDAAQLLVEAFQ